MSDVSMDRGSSSPPIEKKSDPTENLAQFVNDTVFGYLQPKLGLRNEDKRALLVTEEHARRVLRKRLDMLQFMLSPLIYVMYAPYGISLDMSDDIAVRTASDVKAVLSTRGAWRPMIPYETLARCLRFAFTDGAYLGDAVNRLQTYLLNCWNSYRKNPRAYKSPDVDIVQSSGFGKSRLLYQFAQSTSKPDSILKVLYTCSRSNDLVEFPTSTVSLQDWLFAAGQDEKKVSEHLVTIYFYAQENRSSVGTEWLALFTEDDADKNVEGKLKAAEAKRSAKRAGLSHLGTSTPRRKDGVVFIVVDAAKSLMAMETDTRLLFRRALVLANGAIRSEGFKGGIFGVFVDANPNVSDSPPSLKELNDLSRLHPEDPMYAFPPFILAETMDIFWKGIISQRCNGYEGAVTSGDVVAWDVLVSMGRPLWWSTFRALIDPRLSSPVSRESATEHVISLAASKLLRGLDPSTEASYNESIMFGVAALLCRLGIRPYCTSALASHVVADFMAVLEYVDHGNVSRLSTYTSDPVLSFGATHLWYVWSSGKASSLSKFILPQFKKLILNETVDSGDVGEAVARIVLLLAIDRCVMQKVGKERSMCQFMGKFVSVLAFLKLLGGFIDDKQLKEKGTGMMDTSEHDEVKWKEGLPELENWQMGFSYFVQLSLEPTEETLWFMLGRRAAGMFARGRNGFDLIIPIFREPDKRGGKREISMICIQRENRERDGEFLLSSWEMVSNFGSRTPTDRTSPKLFKLCLHPLGACAFIDEAVQEQLVGIVQPLWDPNSVLTLIKADLRHRKVMMDLRKRAKLPSREVVADEELEAVARCALLPAPGLAKAKRGGTAGEEGKGMAPSGDTGASAKTRKRKIDAEG